MPSSWDPEWGQDGPDLINGGDMDKAYFFMGEMMGFIRLNCFGMLLIFLLPALMPENSFAQKTSISGADLAIPDSGTVQILTTSDGSTLMGRIVEIRENDLIFRTEMGDLTISISKITEIKEVSTNRVREGVYWFENPNTTRLYFSPTARMLKKGEGYFSDYMLFFPGVAYGFSDNFTFGAGMTLIPGVDIDNQIFYFTPKFGLKTSHNSNIAAGALILALPEIDDRSPVVGLLCGVGTFGDPDGSLTVGLGYGFVEDEIVDKPMFMIGGEKRISRRVSFVSENWVFPEVDQPLVSGGFRFFGEGLSVDLALINTIGEDTIFPGIPWVDFVFNF